MDILSLEIAEVVSPCLPHGLWSHTAIRVFLLLGTVCPWHPPYPVLPSCPLSRVFPYPQPGDAGGCRSAPAVCQSLTSADPSEFGGSELWTVCLEPFLHHTSCVCCYITTDVTDICFFKWWEIAFCLPVTVALWYNIFWCHLNPYFRLPLLVHF